MAIDWTARIDKIVLNRFLGIPIFLVFLYLVFIASIKLGGALQPVFELTAKAIFIDAIHNSLVFLGTPQWVNHLFVFGIGQGIQTTISFIPVLSGIFLSLTFLETSGCMGRAALIMDKIMRWIGLPGKSFIPMMIGFGCNVPAVMAARTLENHHERILTILMSPFMSCSARLAIYVLFVTAFFPENGHNIIFGLYVIGLLAALLTGLILQKIFLLQEKSALTLKLSPYRWPNVWQLVKVTKRRLKQFVLKAGGVIVLLSVMVSALNLVQDKTGMNNGLAVLGRSITPIFAPMGIKKDNWPATVGLLTGIVAKEVMVGTLNALYAEEDRQANAFGTMVKRFGSPAAAFAYLLFVLLYFPCISVVAVITKELNRKWAVFSVVWTTGIAYITAVVFYQSTLLLETPVTALSWVLGMLGLLYLGFYGIRKAAYFKHWVRTTKPLPTPILILDR